MKPTIDTHTVVGTTRVPVDGQITLCRYKNPATGRREFWTEVHVEAGASMVTVDGEQHKTRAQEAIDSAKAKLPEIIQANAEAKAKAEAEREAMLAQIKAETGDVGPRPDEADDPDSADDDPQLPESIADDGSIAVTVKVDENNGTLIGAVIENL